MEHKTRTKALTWLLSLALVLGLFPGMSLTAYADTTEELLTTITATGKEQASYSVANVATVSFSYTTNGSSSYTNNGKTNWGWWGYGFKATVTAAEGYTITKCVFYDDANRTATDSEAPFVVETTEGDKTPQVNGTPILANQSKGITKIEVYGYATPAADGDTSYTLTIPSTLSVEKSGWNATDGISATGTLASGKKLVVTASSDGEFALVSGENKVNYKLAASGDTNTTYANATEKTSWEFKTLGETAATQPMGIIVENYDDKPAGTYTDTVTFTAAVEDNLVSFTIMRDVNSNSSGNYSVAPGTTWQQFIDSGNAPACLSIYNGHVFHDMDASIMDCGGTCIANISDNKRVKPNDVIIDGATYACSDYLNYKDHD